MQLLSPQFVAALAGTAVLVPPPLAKRKKKIITHLLYRVAESENGFMLKIIAVMIYNYKIVYRENKIHTIFAILASPPCVAKHG